MDLSKVLISCVIAINLFIGHASCAEDSEQNTKQESIGYVRVVASKNLTQSSFGGTELAEDYFVTEDAIAPLKLTELLEDIPGVAFNGQGGLWQAFSVRGLSKWRVTSLVAGVPIYTERRAGNALSFIDPMLIDSVQVIKGPASTYYGSGAMGGALDVIPREFIGSEASFVFDTFGDQTATAVGYGEQNFSTGIAYRSENNDTNSIGEPLNNGFEQFSAFFNKRWLFDNDVELQLLFIPTYGKNIGKSSIEYPEKRITEYPWEKHNVLSLDIRSQNQWGIKLFNHNQHWQSDVVRVESRQNIIEYRSIDSGINWQSRWNSTLFSHKFDGQWGLDWTRRNQVDINERQYSLDGMLSFEKNNLLGSQDEIAVYGDFATSFEQLLLSSGVRFSNVQQSSNFGSSTLTHTTGFIAAVQSLNDYWSLDVQFGNGFRFPSLTEMYFSGSTGRGEVIGNPDLKAETNKNLELGVRYDTEKWYWHLSAFKMWVDNYIERVSVAEEVLSYLNVAEGDIKGIESILAWQLNDEFSLQWIYQYQKGTDDSKQPLADVSPNEHQLKAEYQWESAQASMSYNYRLEHNAVGPGELALESRELINASFSYQFESGVEFKLWGKNLTDSEYRYTADDLSPIAEGRHFGIQVNLTY